MWCTALFSGRRSVLLYRMTRIIYNRPKKKKKRGYEQVREHSHPCVPILKMHFGLLSLDLSPQQVSCQWGDKEVGPEKYANLDVFPAAKCNHVSAEHKCSSELCQRQGCSIDYELTSFLNERSSSFLFLPITNNLG